MKHWKAILVGSFVWGAVGLLVQNGCDIGGVSGPAAKVSNPRTEIVITSYAPTNWNAAGNVYETDDFIWAGEKISTLSQWQQTTGSDADSCQQTSDISHPLAGD